MVDKSADNEQLPASQLEIRERRGTDGRLVLALDGELDLATVTRLDARLRQLKLESYEIELDLSGLQFIDSRGLQAIILALEDARDGDRTLVIGREVSGTVARTIQISGVSDFLWPAA